MREHITPVLASLHRLPVVFRIDLKIPLHVYKPLNGLAPLYLYDCLPRYVPNRPLRSSNADLLDVPTMTYKKYVTSHLLLVEFKSVIYVRTLENIYFYNEVLNIFIVLCIYFYFLLYC